MATSGIPDVAAIKSLIQSFFDTINASDAKGLQTHFLPRADLTIIRQDPPLAPPSASPFSSLPVHSPLQTPAISDSSPKLTVLIRTNIETFVKMIKDGEKRRKGKPGPVLHEAPDLDATDVHIDALFGTAWSPFRVTFDDVLHHYGTMVFTLAKADKESGEKEWKIEGLTQSYRRTPGWEGETSAFI